MQIAKINTDKVRYSYGKIYFPISYTEDDTKEDKINVQDSTSSTIAATANTYYNFSSEVNTLDITLPTNANGVSNIIFFFTTGDSPAVTFTGGTIYYQKDYEIAANSTYEVNALWNGAIWVIAALEIEIPSNNP